MDLRLQVVWGWDRRVKSDRGLGGPFLPSEKSVFHAFLEPQARSAMSVALCGLRLPIDTMPDLTAADLASDSRRFGGLCRPCAAKAGALDLLERLGARLVDEWRTV
jgi:hypothetical protein